MLDDVRAVLARVQDDFDFYVGCQTDPDSTLAGYNLTAEERSALSEPDRLDSLLKHDLRPRNIPSITIKISGRHDWVNRAPKKQKTVEQQVVYEIEAVKTASSEEERNVAALRLIERIG